MAIIDILKRKKKKPEEKKEKPVKKAKQVKKPKEIKKEEPSEGISVEKRRLPLEKAPSEAKPREVKARKFFEAWKILKAPQITEKATSLIGKNQYVFKVWPRANKVEIKKAIENLYGVDVISVKIIKVPKKPRRLGRISGWRKGYKKAIVKVKEGQKIEVLPR